MFGALARRVFGTANDRTVKSLQRAVQTINAKKSEVQALDDGALRARTDKFRERLAKGEMLDSILVDAFATVREAARRVLGQRHFDVQLIGGMVLHQGKIAEMKTGEGKTLVSTLAAYLNAIEGKGVHVVTVNDYLARRDSHWMGQVHRFLGLTVGVILPGMDDHFRRLAYAADITYGTNNEFGFDYLRDNMKYSLDQMVQRPFNFAVVDEVDSILVDESRTPLIISGPTEDNYDLYRLIDTFIPGLGKGDFEKDEKQRTVILTEAGQERIENGLREAELIQGGLYDVENVAIVHHVNQALRANKLFTRDVDYIVKDDKVIIIDEFTGRMMDGRRYSEGLHQALEAKEQVTIQNENQTLASITFQNYFRLYPKLSGMTGTALTEAGEFGEIYKLEVVAIPTNRPVQRKDTDDEVYRTEREKIEAIVTEVKQASTKGQPVLIGTVSIEKSELISRLFTEAGVPHQVLNARYHEQEAQIVAQAGRPGAVTIATNMAGRGTDIQLGGNLKMRVEVELADVTDEAERIRRIAEITAQLEEAKAKVMTAGGLYVIGSERHESRRIDNQLRGRSGRQGDPGASKFFVSLEDDLMRIFGSERIDGMLKRLGLEEGEAITHPWINRALEKAQQKIEARNFDIRKNLLRYDDVMNDQRKVVYEQRREMMNAERVDDTVLSMRYEVIGEIVSEYAPEKSYPEQWKVDELAERCSKVLAVDLPIKDWTAEEGIDPDILQERITEASDAVMAQKIEAYGAETMHRIEKSLLLQIIDHHWKEHLLQLDYLRQGIVLRAYAQKDPLNEYKREAFSLFEAMIDRMRETVTQVLSHLEIRIAGTQPQEAERLMQPKPTAESLPGPAAAIDAPGEDTPPGVLPAGWERTPRNKNCLCGSGKKFKHCHGRLV